MRHFLARGLPLAIASLVALGGYLLGSISGANSQLAILLTSGLTVTWAHWGLKKGSRTQLNLGLFLTVALGILFLCLQAYEYIHAYHELNLTLASGAYGATFFTHSPCFDAAGQRMTTSGLVFSKHSR